jgi:hypothetical protein
MAENGLQYFENSQSGNRTSPWPAVEVRVDIDPLVRRHHLWTRAPPQRSADYPTPAAALRQLFRVQQEVYGCDSLVQPSS